jgi:altronate hydrolase
VRKYNQIHRRRHRRHRAGAHVHVQNCAMSDSSATTPSAPTWRPTEYFTGQDRATFQGIVREDGRVATRNFIGVLTTVKLLRDRRQARRRRVREWRARRVSRMSTAWSRWCTAPAAAWRPRARASMSCSAFCWGYLRHPNFAGVLLIGLGCEAAQIRFLLEAYGIKATDSFQYMTIQGTGGTRATIEEGVKRVKAMLPKANQAKRETVSRALSLCLQCGGSDGYSGITANPALAPRPTCWCAMAAPRSCRDARDLRRRASADRRAPSTARSARS